MLRLFKGLTERVYYSIIQIKNRWSKLDNRKQTGEGSAVSCVAVMNYNTDSSPCTAVTVALMKLSSTNNAVYVSACIKYCVLLLYILNSVVL